MIEENQNILDDKLSMVLINAREIKKWIKEKKTTKLPSASSKDKQESKLGGALNHIRDRLLKPYRSLKTEEEKEEFKKKHPEYEEVSQIIDEIRDEIDRQNVFKCIATAKNIQEWLKEHNTIKLPDKYSKDEQERKFACELIRIRQKVLTHYENLKTEEEKKEDRNKYPEYEELKEIVDEIYKNHISPYLFNIRKIQEWMKENQMLIPPSIISENEQERKYARILISIKSNLLIPYMSLKNEQERKMYKEKYPEYEEIKQIVDEIYEEYFKFIYLANAMQIKEWMKKNNTIIPPDINSKDREEKRLGQTLKNIINYLQEPSENFDTIEKKKEYIEVKKIIDEIDEMKNKKVEQLTEKNITNTEMLPKIKEIEEER